MAFYRNVTNITEYVVVINSLIQLNCFMGYFCYILIIIYYVVY